VSKLELVSTQDSFRLLRTIALFLVIVLAGCHTGTSVIIVKDGSPVSVMILAEKPTRSAQLAALELQEHVRLATGATIEITREPQKPPKGFIPIYIGENAATRSMGLASQKFKIQESLVRVTEKSIVLIGRDDSDTGAVSYEKNGAWPGFNLVKPFYRLGTLNAAYDFLEKFCGVRWYMVTDLGRVVPKNKNLILEPIERRFESWTSYRILGRGSWGTPGDLGKVDLYGKRRYKKWAPARDMILHALRSRRGGEPFGVNHSVYGYDKRFGKKHPDWFVDSNPGRDVQLRFDNPEVIAQVISDAKNYFALPFSKRRFGAPQIHASRVAGGDFFPVMPLDNRSYGDKPNPPLQLERQGRGFGSGVYSNYVFTWVNNVANGIIKDYPDAWISTCAYAGMFEPPDFNMAPNVAVVAAMADGWTPGGYGLEILKAWRKRVSRLYTWEYYYANNRFPKIRPHKVARYITNVLYPMRIDGMFMEMGDVNAVLYHLDHYVTTRLLVDGALDVEELLDEYYSLFYGPAAGPMKRFWNLLEEMNMKVGKTRAGKSWVTAAAEGRLEGLEKHLDEAQRLAPAEPFASRLKLMRIAGLDMIKERVAFYREIVAAGTPHLDISRTPKAPVIDGKLNDEAWKRASVTPPFVTMLNKPQDVKTVAMVTYDAKNIYIAFRCEEPFMKKMKLHHTKPSSAICTDESIEVNIDMDRSTDDYLQIMVSAKGITWWWWRKKFRPQELPDLGIKAAAVMGNKEWTCELAIPFAKINNATPKAKETWGINLMRNRGLKDAGFKRFDERRWACWSPPFAWSWHIKDRFGTMTFK